MEAQIAAEKAAAEAAAAATAATFDEEAEGARLAAEIAALDAQVSC